MESPAFDYAGAIGKRNQASERWLPHVSQQGISSTTPDAPLWLRGNDLKEWKRLRGGRAYPGALWSGPNGLGEASTVAKNSLECPWFPNTPAVVGSLWQGRTVRRVAS